MIILDVQGQGGHYLKFTNCTPKSCGAAGKGAGFFVGVGSRTQVEHYHHKVH